jgi:hypothetical protein
MQDFGNGPHPISPIRTTDLPGAALGEGAGVPDAAAVSAEFSGISGTLVDDG